MLPNHQARSPFVLKHTTSLVDNEFQVRKAAYRRASVASETLTAVKMKKSGMFVYWRASVASETVY